MNKHTVPAYLAMIGATFTLVIGYYAASFLTRDLDAASFNGSRAYADIQAQMSFGPRTPGSAGHSKTVGWIQSELKAAGWTSEIQISTQMGHAIRNIIAKRDNEPPMILVGAHYDTRIVADQDPDPQKQNAPVPGANDGASGVAVLLELARTLPQETVPVWLVFFDAEDNGRIDGWDWLLGSRAFVEEFDGSPNAVVVVDMVGDTDLNLYYEKNSDMNIRAEIWKIAADLGYEEAFLAREKYSILDDHIPFLESGIPAVNIIDIDYPYWHTTEDTLDKVSEDSLQKVGDTLWYWITSQTRK
ncbi:MAG: M28 family peptidase [Anaerolineaceae bacterium]|nr:M28 family peptidase [Anaerolineaceae bacterium]